MRMSEKKELVPVLRFPEFKDGGEWEEKKISELGGSISGLAGKASNDFGKGEAYITYKQVFDNSIINFEECGRVQIAENENQNTLQKGDILFTASSETPNEVGFASVIMESPKEKTYLNSFCFALRPISLKLLQPSFSRYLFHSELYRKAITRLAQGGIRYNISKIAFLDLNIFIPQKDEQIRISDCLSSIDKLITAERKKLELFKRHKKGLMQNLFPQEGEKMPQVRFPEFKDSGEWEEKTLGEIGNFIGGGTPDTSIQDYWDGNILWYTPAEIRNEKLKTSIRKISEQGLKKSSAKLLPPGTILITTRATIGDVAITQEECTTNQGFQSLIVNNSEINTFWFYWILHHKEDLIKRASGSTFKEIGKNEIINITTLSPEKNEQRRIADCLSSLDELISVQTKKIEQLKLHKKGLMQGLFPKMEE